MGYNPQGLMNIYEIIRRWHQGHTISGTARALSLDRKTVRGYIKQARDAGLSRDRPLDEEPKVLAALQRLVPADERPRPAAEQFAPHREEILLLLDDPNDPLTLKSSWEVIRHRHPEITASYSSLKRVVRQWKPRKKSTWRHEIEPGLQIQVD